MQARLFSLDTALITQRTVVRRFRENEGKQFYKLVSENRDYLADHFPGLFDLVSDLESTEALVRTQLAEWLLQEGYAFGIWRSAEPELIGYIRIFNLDWHTPKAEVSYFLDRRFTRRGIMTEVLARVIGFAFRDLEMAKIYLHTLQDNYPSQRVARRIGFRREGDLRDSFRSSTGTLQDLLRFGLTRSEYGE
ncbi:MAG: GNAT family protein [Saprospiraceae bacterium]